MNRLIRVGFCLVMSTAAARAQQPGPAFTPAPAAAVSPEQMNAAFGIPLWGGSGLWSEPIADVAERLKAREESLADGAASYRARADAILGIAPETIRLIGKDGKTDSVLVLFANKGDTLGLEPKPADYASPKEYRDALRGFQDRKQKLARTIAGQGAGIEKALATLLGPSATQRFGAGGKMTEWVKTWQWDGHVFLLSEQKDESLSLRIVPPAAAAARGRAERVSDGDLKAELKTRVLRRENGDVIVTGIPMIDQGRKGYCVPATWARYLRYMGIPADEYTLANAAQTRKGGGTSASQMLAAVAQLAKQNRRGIKTLTGKITLRRVSASIDDGLPIMWRMYSIGPFEGVGQPAGRMGAESPAAWKAALEPARRAAKQLKPAPDERHMCLIIGYNPLTEEIATSDSWGPEHAEKWYTVEEVQAVCQGEQFFIDW